MRIVNINEAKTTLSQLVEAVESGETVVLARAGEPVVQLVRLKEKRGIKLGGLKGRIPAKLMTDIAKPLSKAELARLFGGGFEQ